MFQLLLIFLSLLFLQAFSIFSIILPIAKAKILGFTLAHFLSHMSHKQITLFLLSKYIQNLTTSYCLPDYLLDLSHIISHLDNCVGPKYSPLFLPFFFKSQFPHSIQSDLSKHKSDHILTLLKILYCFPMSLREKFKIMITMVYKTLFDSNPCHLSDLVLNFFIHVTPSHTNLCAVPQTC